MNKLLSFIAQETDGDSYSSHKYCFETQNVLNNDYDKHKRIVLRRFGETDRGLQEWKHLERKAKNIFKHSPPLFRYFLDGSRRTYKIDDIAYGKRLYPLVAGQIGVGCCERVSKEQFKPKVFKRNIVLVLPKCADKDGKPSSFFKHFTQKANALPLLQKRGIQFTKTLYYADKKLVNGESYENLAIARIQDEMIEQEKKVVADLALNNELRPEAYLIKDGSLEYRRMGLGAYKDLSMIRSNYKRVVGVSKSFNPERCVDKNNRSNALKIAHLPVFARTPAYIFESDITGGVRFCVWYLRLREPKHTISPFDGIIKVEKILVSEQEQEYGLDSEEIDVISANLINERNPVCFGNDDRWANHLYPIFLTESFIKSKYLSDHHLLNVF